MNLFATAGLSVGISCTVLSLITLFFGKTKLHRLLLYFNLAVALWGFGLSLVGIADSGAKAITAWKIANSGGFLIAPLFYHLVSHFCGNMRNKILYFAYLQALFFMAASIWTERVFSKVRYAYDLYYNVASPLYTSAVIIYLFLVLLSYYELIRFLEKTRGRKRLQTQYIIFGFMFGFIGGTSTFLPMYQINLFYPFGNFGITLYVFILTYSILRHRLMDIHLMFRRTMGYSLAAGLLTGLFVLIVLVMTGYISDLAGHTSWRVNIIAAFIIAILFNPLQLIIDKMFYKTKYDYYATIKKAGSDLVKLIKPGDIQRYILDVIFETLKIKSAYLVSMDGKCFNGEYLVLPKGKTSDENMIQKTDNDSELARLLKIRKDIIVKEELPEIVEQDKIDILAEELKPFCGEITVPIFIEDELAFILILGEKLSGDIYSDEDINLLSTISNQAAISLKNAMLYGELEQRVKDRTAELESAKDEIEAWSKELEKRVKEKTEELVKSQEQLIHSEKLSAMGQMAGGLAHELNSPLGGLLPLIEKYRNDAGEGSSEFKELSLMLQACKHMAKVVRDFGSFSRQSNEEYQELDVNEAIEDTLSFGAGNLKEKGIRIIREYENDLPKVKGEKTGLQQVVLNMVTNACDALPWHGTLTIKTGSSSDKSSVAMEFIDNGEGIEKENLNKIFDPFFTTKRPGKGTGLGLSVSYGIVEKHNGTISVESELGKGSRFIISLPIAKA